MTKVLYLRVPESVHADLTTVAQESGCTINGAAIHILSRALGGSTANIDEAIERVRAGKAGQ